MVTPKPDFASKRRADREKGKLNNNSNIRFCIKKPSQMCKMVLGWSPHSSTLRILVALGRYSQDEILTYSR